MNIEGVQVGGDAPCRFVAEISNNHNGSLLRCIRLINAAKHAGAEFVKFQCYTPEELCYLRGDGPAPEPWGKHGWSMYSLYEKARTPLEWFPHLYDHARAKGLVPFSSVFGMKSLEVLESVNNPCYKISKFERNVPWLHNAVLDTTKPVLVSVPERENYRLPVMDEAVLYCPGGYPCDIKDVHLPDDFEAAGFLGLSSHCLNPDLPRSAVTRGCKMIEMHFMLDDEPSELEANVSLTASQFAAMVRAVRRAEQRAT